MSGVKRKITEISVYEFYMCMFVITIHLLSDGVDNFARWSAESIIFSSLTRIISFAVPGFIFTSAIKLFYKYSDRKFSYPKFLFDRFLKVYIPYVIAVCIYYIVYVFVLTLDEYPSFNWTQLGSYIWSGNISAQFYFVILIVQFYLLMPIWRLLSKLKSVPSLAVVIAAALALTILSRMYFPQAAAAILEQLGKIEIPNIKLFSSFTLFNPLSGYSAGIEQVQALAAYTNKSFSSYLVFWICGMYIGLNYDAFSEKIKSGKLVIYIGWLVFAVAHCVLSYLRFCGVIRYTFEPTIVVLFCIFSIFGFLIYIDRVTFNLESRGKGFLTSIAGASYEIYLIHCLVIMVVTYYLKQADIDSTMTRFWITAVITYTFSIIFCVLESTLYMNLKLKYRRRSAANARKSARRKRYL